VTPFQAPFTTFANGNLNFGVAMVFDTWTSVNDGLNLNYSQWNAPQPGDEHSIVGLKCLNLQRALSVWHEPNHVDWIRTDHTGNPDFAPHPGLENESNAASHDGPSDVGGRKQFGENDMEPAAGLGAAGGAWEVHTCD
jgi:hypothetical protein